MNYNYRYRIKPDKSQQEALDYHRDTCRQLYNHTLYRLDQIPESEGTVKQRVRQIRDELPDMKDWWTELTNIYSKALQPTVMRVAKNIKRLGKLKENGNKVGELNWKAPHEFRSFTYNQSGFGLDKKSGQTVLSLSKLGDIPIELHRPLPENVTIKQVTLKKEKTGDWFAIFGLETNTETPDKTAVNELNKNDIVGIDVGILKYVHDTDGTAVESLDLSDERERLEREQRKLSRKEHGSNNWEKQRQKVAECHQEIKRKRHDFLHKLSDYYATKYELVAVEDLDVKDMMESLRNSRNTASSAWSTFTDMLEYKCEREGTYFVEVAPEGTTKECAQCGVETDKPLWVREHSCPSCGFEADRDANAALNILSRGLSELGVVHSEGTPVETVTAVGDDSHESVSASCVVESGSPNINERAKASE